MDWRFIGRWKGWARGRIECRWYGDWRMLSSVNIIKSNFLESKIPGLGEAFEIASHPEFKYLLPAPTRRSSAPASRRWYPLVTGASLPTA